MTADQFLGALRAEGLTVTEHPGWKTHNRNHAGPWGPLHGVLVHHTAGHEAGSSDILYNGISGLPGPLCHAGIHKSGVVECIGWGRANHAGGGDPDVLNAVIAERHPLPATNEHQGSDGAVDGNPHFVGYECVNLGDGNDPWPSIQLEAIARACAAVARFYGWSVNSVIRHMDWSDWKPDPKGFSWSQMRTRITTILAGRPNATAMSGAAWDTNGGNGPITENPEGDSMEPVDVWAFKGQGDDKDALWYQRNVDRVVWGYKGTGEPNDAYAFLRGTNAKTDTILTRLDALVSKVDALTVKVDSLVTTGMSEAQIAQLATAVVDEFHRRTAE
jgi:hypothetical protein